MCFITKKCISTVFVIFQIQSCLKNVKVGRHSRINRAIIDKNVAIPPYTEIGFNREEDLKRGFFVSEGGITVVPKDAIVD